MAKTLASIKMNFDSAVRKASELEGLAEQMENLAENNAENILQNVGKAWTGEASRDYLKKGRRIKNKMEDCASQLKEIAGTIRTTARIVYDAERAAILLAQTREK